MSTENWDLEDWKKGYKEMQALQTRSAEELKQRDARLLEYQRQVEEGSLVKPQDYVDGMAEWARRDPAAARKWFEGDLLGSPSNAHANDAGKSQTWWEKDGFSDAIFDPDSDEYQQFVQRHGYQGFQKATTERAASKIMETELGGTLRSAQQQIDELRALVQQRQQQPQNSATQQQYEERMAALQREIAFLKNPELAELHELAKGAQDMPAMEHWKKHLEGIKAQQRLAELEQARQERSKASPYDHGDDNNILVGQPVTPVRPANDIVQRMQQSEGSGAASAQPGATPHRRPFAGFPDIAREAMAQVRSS